MGYITHQLQQPPAVCFQSQNHPIICLIFTSLIHSFCWMKISMYSLLPVLKKRNAFPACISHRNINIHCVKKESPVYECLQMCFTVSCHALPLIFCLFLFPVSVTIATSNPNTKQRNSWKLHSVCVCVWLCNRQQPFKSANNINRKWRERATGRERGETNQSDGFYLHICPAVDSHREAQHTAAVRSLQTLILGMNVRVFSGF